MQINVIFKCSEKRASRKAVKWIYEKQAKIIARGRQEKQGRIWKAKNETNAGQDLLPFPGKRGFAMKNPNRLRVMSFNIRHGRGEDQRVDLRRIAEVIRSSGADVVGLQEVDRFLPRSGMVDEAAELARMLGMRHCFAASLTFGTGEYGNALLSRYPIAESRFERLPDQGEIRSLLTAELEPGAGRLTILVTHLGLKDADRRGQLTVIAERLRGLGQPAVLAGDFNARTGDPALRLLPAEFRKVPLIPAGSSTLHSGGEIDHLFANFGGDQVTARTLPSDASDHDPVVADFPLVPAE